MEKINNRNLKISFIINILIVLMTMSMLIIALTGVNFMGAYEPFPRLPKYQYFSYFTVQSNVFMGIVSFVFAIKEYHILKGKKKDNTIKILYFKNGSYNSCKFNIYNYICLL